MGDYGLYVDGSVKFKRHPAELVEILESGDKADIAFFPHTHRKTVYEEFGVIVTLKLDTEQRLHDARVILESTGSMNLPLLAGGVFVFKNCLPVNNFLHQWLWFTVNYCSRDQLFLPVALQDMMKLRGLTWKTLPGSIFDNEFVEVMPHR